MSLPADVDLATWEKVREAFAEALGLDEDEVDFDSRVIGDLGAESLDFLDLAFRLERAFDIRIPRGGIEEAARSELGDEPYEVDGILTERALQGLRQALPEVPAEELHDGLQVDEVPLVFRAATFYHLVLRLRDAASIAEA